MRRHALASVAAIARDLPASTSFDSRFSRSLPSSAFSGLRVRCCSRRLNSDRRFHSTVLLRAVDAIRPLDAKLLTSHPLPLRVPPRHAGRTLEDALVRAGPRPCVHPRTDTLASGSVVAAIRARLTRRSRRRPSRFRGQFFVSCCHFPSSPRRRYRRCSRLPAFSFNGLNAAGASK